MGQLKLRRRISEELGPAPPIKRQKVSVPLVEVLMVIVLVAGCPCALLGAAPFVQAATLTLPRAGGGGGERAEGSPAAAARGGEGASSMSNLRTKVGLPGNLESQGLKDSDLPRLAKLAMQDGCHAFNPRPCSEDDMLDLYTKCLH